MMDVLTDLVLMRHVCSVCVNVCDTFYLTEIHSPRPGVPAWFIFDQIQRRILRFGQV